MSIRVRLGTKDDIPALVEVECSDVEEWYHFSPEGRGEKASYDELSSLERVMHGGPWMDPEALAEYWKVIERLGIIPLVAEIDGKVVGHLDVVFSDELPLGRFLYLDVLTVHKAYRRRGVATALIKEAEGLARERNVDFLLVQPEKYEGPSGLTYRSCGFKKAFDVYQLEIHIGHPRIPSGVQLASIPQVQEPPLRTHVMMCGWGNISKKTWDFGVNPNVEMLSAFSQHMLALCALKNETKYFFHVYQKLFQRTKGSLHLWSPTPLNQKFLQDVFQAAKTVASWLGIKTLTTKTIERYVAVLEKLGFSVRSKAEPYLVKRLR
ncbi:hypothetical protein DRO57_01410 [Candidatus Bathyarchaeota archaeon]|nr:MAG: hypothetical protein DRO57_01410 [Candidatus Bathyarchaeota archaeon]